jgi:hypothetical protein
MNVNRMKIVKPALIVCGLVTMDTLRNEASGIAPATSLME